MVTYIYIYLFNNVRSFLQGLGAFGNFRYSETLHRATNSARGHFGATWVAQTSARGHFGVTSGSLCGHRARPELSSGSRRGHFGVTWLAQNSARGHFGVTSGSLGSRKLGSRSLRGHLARENSARSHFEVEKTQENSARNHFEVEKT